MEQHLVQLTDDEYGFLNKRYPRGTSSVLIGNRAIEVVKYFFLKKDPTCRFSSPENGADLCVTWQHAQKPMYIEVKGTESDDISWLKLKVSGDPSKNLIVSEKIPLYRVTSIFERTPQIYILKYGEDFELIPDPRWSVKPIRNGEDGNGFRCSQRFGSSVGRRSKYEKLREFLLEKSDESIEVTVSFVQLSNVLGFELPESAKRYQAYWANQKDTSNRPWARAWQEAGFKVDSYYLSSGSGWVRFRRKKMFSE